MIGDVIKKMRTERNLSRNKLAKKAGVATSHLRSIELGQCDNPSINVVKKIAAALGVSAKDLLENGR